MPTPPTHPMVNRLYETLGSHQAIMACFDIAAQPEREEELFAAFERMNARIGRENDVASAAVHDSLLHLVFVTVGALKVPKGTAVLDATATDHVRVISGICAALPQQAADAVTLARESPTIGDYLDMYGSGKAHPVPSPMLMRAAVATVRAMTERHGDAAAESRWFVLGQLFGSLCLGAAVTGPPGR